MFQKIHRLIVPTKTDEVDLMRYPQFLLNFCVALHPDRQKTWKIFYRLSYALIGILFAYLHVVEIITVYGDLNALTPVLETTSILIHVFSKWTMLATNQKLLSIILATRKKFWKVQNCTDPTTKDSCQKFSIRSYLFMMVHSVNSHMVLVTYSLKIFTGQLPLAAHVYENWNFGLISALQTYLNFVYSELVIISDLMFFGLGLELTVQLRLLGAFIKKIDLTKGEAKKEVREAIKQHVVLLSHRNNLSSFYMIAFCGGYFVCVLTVCFELYSLFESNDLDFGTLLRAIIYVTTLYSEIFMYCYIAELLEEEMRNIGKAVAECPWYGNDHFESQKALMMISIQTNQQKEFSAGGLIVINLPTFVNILRSGFSIFTFLKNIKYKKETT